MLRKLNCFSGKDIKVPACVSS